MRMEIRIHSRRHNKHARKTSRVSTRVKISPEFETTKPSDVKSATKSTTTKKPNVNHAGVFNSKCCFVKNAVEINFYW